VQARLPEYLTWLTEELLGSLERCPALAEVTPMCTKKPSGLVERLMMRGISTGLILKAFFGVITGVTLFILPAISAPIAGPKNILAVPRDNSQFVQIRAVRGG
jgi:hypothetical protein